MKLHLALPGAAVAVFLALPLQAANLNGEADILDFTDRHCSSCHNDVDKEGGLDLTSLKYSPSDPENFHTWVKIHDRVQTGEMPPKEKKRPDAPELAAFVKNVSTSLIASEEEILAQSGRSTR